MPRKISEPPVAADALLSDILDVFTASQAIRLIDEIRRLKVLGFGRVTLVINNKQLCQLQLQESYDFRADAEVRDVITAGPGKVISPAGKASLNRDHLHYRG